MKNSSLILELAGLIKFTRPFLGSVSKAKAAKLVRGLVDMFLDMEATTGKEVGGRMIFVLSSLFVCLPSICLTVDFRHFQFSRTNMLDVNRFDFSLKYKLIKNKAQSLLCQSDRHLLCTAIYDFKIPVCV